jgi:hypothetical protein
MEFTLGCHSCHATRRNDVRRAVFARGNALQERIVAMKARAGAIRVVHGPADVDVAPDEAVVLSIGRDSAPWIRSFIEHHLELGARHIFYLDNASADESVALASGYDNVTVLSTELSFRRYEVGMRRWLTRRYGLDRWSLYCDIDELFDYPCSDRLPLAGLLRYLDAHGYRVLTGQMLDLFSGEPFSSLHSSPDDDLKSKYPYYDLTDLLPTRDVYWIRDGLCDNPAMVCWFGGIRKRFFGDACLLLTKHPLVYGSRDVGVYTYDGHFMTGAPVADISGVLRHYKYVASLSERARRTVEQGWHHKAGGLYGGLATVLGSDLDFSLRLDTAVEYRGTGALLDEGFLASTDQYRNWVAREERGAPTTRELR